MSQPRFRPNAFTDLVRRPGATNHRAGLDATRRLANLELGFRSNVTNDPDDSNILRMLGSSCMGFSLGPSSLSSSTVDVVGLSDNVAFFSAVPIPVGGTITGVGVYVYQAFVGTIVTAKLGLYDSSGARVGVSANSTTRFKTTGLVEADFTTPISDASPGLYYAAGIFDVSAITTNCQIGAKQSFSNALTNLRCAAAAPRAVTFSAQTDLAASYTWSSGTTAQYTRFFYVY